MHTQTISPLGLVSNSKLNVLQQALLDPAVDLEDLIISAAEQDRKEIEVIFSYVNYELFLRISTGILTSVNNGDYYTQESGKIDINSTCVEMNLSQDGEEIELTEKEKLYVLHNSNLQA